MRRMKGAAIAVTAGLLAAACSSSSHKSSEATPSAGPSSSVPSASAPATTAPAASSAPASSAPAASAPAASAGASIEPAKWKQGGTVTIANEQGQTWTVPVQPVQPGGQRRVARLRLRAAGLRQPAQQPGRDADAGVGLPVERGQEVDRLHHPRRREVERRAAVHAPPTSRSPST